MTEATPERASVYESTRYEPHTPCSPNGSNVLSSVFESGYSFGQSLVIGVIKKDTH